MMVIGLTGGICSGKSTVAAMFQRLGATVLDADQVAHELVEPGQPLFEVVASAFGREVVGADGRIDRSRLGATVFADPEARRRLEALLHPAIIEECERRIKQAEVAGAAISLIDAALLIESGWCVRCDAVILVEASEAVQLDRLVGSRGLSRNDAMLRIRSQMPQQEKRQYAHYVIENEGPLEETERQVQAVWEQLRTKASSWGCVPNRPRTWRAQPMSEP
jgi:dephospho-CoA kinase